MLKAIHASETSRRLGKTALQVIEKLLALFLTQRPSFRQRPLSGRSATIQYW
jgi:hypothetical protein